MSTRSVGKEPTLHLRAKNNQHLACSAIEQLVYAPGEPFRRRGLDPLLLGDVLNRSMDANRLAAPWVTTGRMRSRSQRTRRSLAPMRYSATLGCPAATAAITSLVPERSSGWLISGQPP